MKESSELKGTLVQEWDKSKRLAEGPEVRRLVAGDVAPLCGRPKSVTSQVKFYSSEVWLPRPQLLI